MRQISNSDYSSVLRFLRDYVNTPYASLREANLRRRAGLLIRKMEARVISKQKVEKS